MNNITLLSYKILVSGLLWLALGYKPLLCQDRDSIEQVVAEISDNAYRSYNSDPISAIEDLLLALDLADTYKLPSVKASVLKNLGLAFWRQAQFDTSLYYYDRSKAIADSIDDQLTVSKLLNNIGLVYQDRGQYSLSLENYLDAYRIQNQFDDDLALSITMINLGILYHQLGNYEESDDFFSRALELAVKEQLTFSICFGSSEAILLYTALGRNEKVEQLYEQAIQSCTQIDNKFFHALGIYNYALMQKESKRYGEAITGFRKSLLILEEVGDVKKQNAVYNQIGIAYLASNDLVQATRYFNSARELAMENDFVDELRTSFYYLSQIDSINGNWEDAYYDYQQFHALSDTLTRRERYNELSEIRIRYGTLQKQKENEVLKKERELQNVIIERQESNRRLYSIIIALAVIVIVVLVILFEQKRRGNKKLVKSNQEKEKKNVELTQTLEELRAAQEQLIRAEKMASLGILSSGVSHEINNPLNYISLGIRNLKKAINREGQMDTDLIAQLIKIVENGVSKASSIVKSLTELTQDGTKYHKKCDLVQIMELVLVSLSDQIGENIRVIKQFEQGSMTIEGNESRLSQAFLNVLLNGIQAISEPGEIKIQMKVLDENYQISITDNGSGIHPNDLNRIGDPFFTTKEPGAGTGLGLSISYRIIEEHGGRVHATSELGAYTRIEMVLPGGEIPQ